MADKKPRMKTIWITLKSGAIVKMHAREFEVNHRGGNIDGYKFDGQPIRTGYFWRRRVMYINPGDISAVEVRGG